MTYLLLQYLQNLTSVLFVSGIHRAVDDKSARDLLGEKFQRQLVAGGLYTRVSFVCTKSDDIEVNNSRR